MVSRRGYIVGAFFAFSGCLSRGDGESKNAMQDLSIRNTLTRSVTIVITLDQEEGNSSPRKLVSASDQNGGTNASHELMVDVSAE